MRSLHIAKCVDKDPELQKQVNLLSSINGIGKITAWAIIAYLGDATLFENAKQVNSYAGLNPSIQKSGTSLKNSRLSKMGHQRLRKALYMPAIVAVKYNPIMSRFYLKMLEKGKPKKVVICAVIRKLFVFAYGALKSGQKFDPEYQLNKC